jgi:YgiT-type zinc finger domain-containing protein
MTKEVQMLIPLICKQCGGKLEVEKSQVFESGNAIVVLNDHMFKCPHCGVEYLPGEEIKHFPSKSTNISINGDSIGDIVIGYGNVINKSSNPATYPTRVNDAQQDHPAIKSQIETKPSRKWWQFWKK